MRRKRRINYLENDEVGIGEDNVLKGFEERKKSCLLEKDFNSLENLLKELFIAIKRSIFLQKFNKNLIEICQKSLILFEDIKQRHSQISISTFEVIPILKTINELEKLADEIDEEIDSDDANGFDIDKKETELERIEEIVSFLIKIFNSYAQLHPNHIDVPDDKVLDFILTIENDWDFELLLIGLAKTKNPRVHKFLKDFEDDTEKDVRDLAKMLLNNFAQPSSVLHRDTLRNLIAKDDLVKTLEMLLDIGKSKNDIELANEVYYQLGRYSRLEKDVRLGTISFQDNNLTRNQIRFSIMELVDKS